MSAREKNPEKDKNRTYKETGGANNTKKSTFSATYNPNTVYQSNKTEKRKETDRKIKQSINKTNSKAKDFTGGANNTIRETDTFTYDKTKKNGKSKTTGTLESNVKSAINNKQYDNGSGILGRYKKANEDVKKNYDEGNASVESSKAIETAKNEEYKSEKNTPGVPERYQKQINRDNAKIQQKKEEELKALNDKIKEKRVNDTYNSSAISVNKDAEELSNIIKGNINVTELPSDERGVIPNVAIYNSGEYGYIVLPTLVNDNGEVKNLSNFKAVERFNNTGEYLGQFKTENEAIEYIDKLRESVGKLNKDYDRYEKSGNELVKIQNEKIESAPSDGLTALTYKQQTDDINRDLKAQGLTDEEITEYWNKYLIPKGYKYVTASDVRKVWTTADAEYLTAYRADERNARETEEQSKNMRNFLPSYNEKLMSATENGLVPVNNKLMKENARKIVNEAIYKDDFWNYAIALSNARAYFTTDQQKDAQYILNTLNVLGQLGLNDDDWKQIEEYTGMNHDEIQKIYDVLTTRQSGGRQMALGALNALPFAEQIFNATEKDTDLVSFNTVDYLNGNYSNGQGYQEGKYVSADAIRGIEKQKNEVYWANKIGSTASTIGQMMLMGLGTAKLSSSLTSKVMSALDKAKFFGDTAVMTDAAEIAIANGSKEITKKIVEKAISATINNTYMTAKEATKVGYDTDNFIKDWALGELTFLAMDFASFGTGNLIDSIAKDTVAKSRGIEAVTNAVGTTAERMPFDVGSNMGYIMMKQALSSAGGALAGATAPYMFMSDEEKEALAEGFGESFTELFLLSFGMEAVGRLRGQIKTKNAYKQLEQNIKELMDIEVLKTQYKTKGSAEEIANIDINTLDSVKATKLFQVQESIKNIVNNPELSGLLSAQDKQFLTEYFYATTSQAQSTRFGLMNDPSQISRLEAMKVQADELYPSNESSKCIEKIAENFEFTTNNDVQETSNKLIKERAILAEAKLFLENKAKWNEISEEARGVLANPVNANYFLEMYKLPSIDLEGVDSAHAFAITENAIKGITESNKGVNNYVERGLANQLGKNGSYSNDYYEVTTEKLADDRTKVTVFDKNTRLGITDTFTEFNDAVKFAKETIDARSNRSAIEEAFTNKKAYDGENIMAKVRDTNGKYYVTVTDKKGKMLSNGEVVDGIESPAFSTINEAIDFANHYEMNSGYKYYNKNGVETEISRSLRTTGMYDNTMSSVFARRLSSRKGNKIEVRIIDKVTGKETVTYADSYPETYDIVSNYEAETVKSMKQVIKEAGFTPEVEKYVSSIVDDAYNTAKNKIIDGTKYKGLRNKVPRKLAKVLQGFADGSVTSEDVLDLGIAISDLRYYQMSVELNSSAKSNAKEFNAVRRAYLDEIAMFNKEKAKEIKAIGKELSKANKKIAEMEYRNMVKATDEKIAKYTDMALEKLAKNQQKLAQAEIKRRAEVKEKLRNVNISNESEFKPMLDALKESIAVRTKPYTEKEINTAQDVVEQYELLAEKYSNIDLEKNEGYKKAKAIADKTTKTFSELSGRELFELDNAIDNIVHLNRTAKNMVLQNKVINRAIAVETAYKNMQSAKKFAGMKFLGETTTPRILMGILDGFAKNGVYTSSYNDLVNSYNKGTDHMYQMMSTLTEKLNSMGKLKEWANKEKLKGTGITVQITGGVIPDGYEVTLPSDKNINPKSLIELELSDTMLMYLYRAQFDTEASAKLLGDLKPKNVTYEISKVPDEYKNLTPQSTRTGKDGKDYVTYKIVEPTNGYLRVPDKKLWQKGKYTEAIKNGYDVMFDIDKMAELNKLMTTEMLEFDKFAKWMYKANGDVMNEIYYDYDGTIKVTRDDYVHMNGIIDTTSVKQDSNVRGGGAKIKNQSANQQRVEAHTSMYDPLVVDSIVRNLIKSSDTVSKDFSLKSADNMRYLVADNSYIEGTSVSMNDAIIKKFGNGFAKSVNKFVNDATELSTSYSNSAFDKILGNYANAVTAINAGTALKQFPSYFAVMEKFGVANSIKGLGKSVDKELVLKYSSALKERMMKKGIVSMTSLSDRDFDIYSKKFNLTNGMDITAVKQIWAVAEEYYKSINKKAIAENKIIVGSDSYYKEVAKIYDEAIYETQPGRNKLVKSNLQRNTKGIVKALTLFTAQPTQNFNMTLEGFLRKENYKKQGISRNSVEWKEASLQQARNFVGQTVQALMIGGITLGNAFLYGNTDSMKDADGNLTLAPVFDENGEVETKGIALEYLDNVFASALGMLPFYGTGKGVYDRLAGKYSGSAISLPQEDVVNDIVDSFKTIFSGFDGGDEYKIKRGIKNLAIGVSTACGIPSEYVFKVTNNTLCQLSPEFNAWYQHTYYGTDLASVKDNPSAFDYVIDEYNSSLKGTEAESEIRRLCEEDESGTVINNVLYSNTNGDNFNCGESKTNLTVEEQKELKDNTNKLYSDMVNDLVSSYQYKLMSDEEKANAIGEISEYCKKKSQRDYLKELQTRGKYADMYPDTIETNTIGDAIENDVDVNDYLLYRSKTADITSNDSAMKRATLGYLEIDDDSVEKIYRMVFDEDEDLDIVMKEGGLTAREYCQYKTQMDIYDSFIDEPKKWKLDYINDTYDEKGKVALYKNEFETDDTSESNKIDTAINNGINATSFINREAQLCSLDKETSYSKKKNVTYFGGKLKSTDVVKTTTNSTKSRNETLVESGYTNDEITYFYKKENPNDNNMQVAVAIGLQPSDYIRYKTDTSEYKSLTDKDGKTIPSSVKLQKWYYIDNMTLNDVQKNILKMTAEPTYSMETSDYQQIISYVNNLNISKEEKLIVYDTIGLKVIGDTVYPEKE